jgi:cytochrome c oxidase subunit 3
MLPLANTIILLTSGVTLVAAHRAIVVKGYNAVLINGLFVTILLGILFSWLQYIEYGLTTYTINDTTYGSAFFMLTGLHGFHVIVGTCLLLVSYFRAVHNQFSTGHHIFFECAA